MNKHYYALSDSFTGHYPKTHTWGFANTKIAIAFKSKLERDCWLKNTFLETAKELTRKEALKYGHDIRGYDNYVVFSTNLLGFEFGVELIKMEGEKKYE